MVRARGGTRGPPLAFDVGLTEVSGTAILTSSAASEVAQESDEIGGGYFLLLASAPVKAPQASAIKREVILVLDRSGSMAGEKFDQAVAAGRNDCGLQRRSSAYWPWSSPSLGPVREGKSQRARLLAAA